MLFNFVFLLFCFVLSVQLWWEIITTYSTVKLTSHRNLAMVVNYEHLWITKDTTNLISRQENLMVIISPIEIRLLSLCHHYAKSTTNTMTFTNSLRGITPALRMDIFAKREPLETNKHDTYDANDRNLSDI